MARGKSSTSTVKKTKSKSPDKTVGKAVKKSAAAPEREPWTPWGKWAKRRREKRERKQREREERRQQRIEARRLRQFRRRLFLARGGVFLGLLGIVLLVVLVVLSVLGRPYPWEAIRDISELQRIEQNLTPNQTRWRSLGIDHYEVEILYTSRDGIRCGPSALEIDSGEVVNELPLGEAEWSDECDELNRVFTVDGGFDRLRSEIAAFEPAETQIHVDFDQDFGYLTQIHVDRYDERSPGCCWDIEWSNLQPLDN